MAKMTIAQRIEKLQALEKRQKDIAQAKADKAAAEKKLKELRNKK